VSAEKPQTTTIFLIRGPLGLWTFPVLNAFLQLFALLASLTPQLAQSPVASPKPRARTYNIVRDERGRIVAIEEIWVE
jgi:hypothetical protein